MAAHPPLRADARRNRARILAAAEAVFAETGAASSTEQVAARAGVAIGTVFRHFPTKADLLAAIMKDVRARLTEELDVLATDGDPATALFTFFSRTVEAASTNRSVVELLAADGIDVQIGQQVAAFRSAVETLLAQARLAGAVREDVGPDEVVALLTAATQGARAGGWDVRLRERTLAIVFDGLRPRQNASVKEARPPQ